jgi:pimeloyl-ACP methyl ester carboxylesterase
MRSSASVNGVSIAFTDTQADRPIALLVHGFALDRRMWDPQIDGLSEHFRVIAPDLRAFGESQAGPPGPLTMWQHADDLGALLDYLGVTQPVLYVGLSMGGYTGFEFWRRHAQRVRAMVLADTKATHDDAERREYREIMARQAEEQGSPAPALELMWPQLCSPSLDLKSEVPRRLRLMMAEQSARAIADGQRGMGARQESVSLLPGMTIPTLVIVGEDDVLTPADESRLMAERLPDSRLHVIRGAGHMSNMEAPEEFNSVLLTWSEGL